MSLCRYCKQPYAAGSSNHKVHELACQSKWVTLQRKCQECGIPYIGLSNAQMTEAIASRVEVDGDGEMELEEEANLAESNIEIGASQQQHDETVEEEEE